MVDGREIAAQFEDAADFETRKVLCGGPLLTVLFLDGLTSGRDIAEQVVRPLAQMTDEAREEVLYTRALQGGVWCASVKEPESTQQAAQLLVNGFCVILFPKSGKALGCEVKTGEKRSPSPPETENTVILQRIKRKALTSRRFGHTVLNLNSQLPPRRSNI